MKKFLSALASILLCAGLFVIPTFAASAEQDGLKAEFATDKGQYNSDEPIHATLTVTNLGDKAISNIVFGTNIPEGYALSEDSEKTKSIKELKPGESSTIKSKIVKTANSAMPGKNESENAGNSNKKNVPANQKIRTGDEANILLWILLATGAIFIVFGQVIWKKKTGTRGLSLLLILGLLGTCFRGTPLTVKAADTKKTFEISETVKISDKNVAFSAFVTYDAPEEETTIDDGLSREEWITQLAALMGWQKVDGQHSFDDYMDAESPEILEAAVRMGVVPLTADSDNMVYFRPKEAVTKEFVAYTAVRALSYQIDETITPDWEDIKDLKYPAEDMQAVNAGIVKITDNKFLPNQVLTVAEMTEVIESIKQILAQDEVGNTETTTINYVDGVEETELVYELDEENKQIYVTDPEKVDNWKQGDIYVLKSEDGTQEEIAIKVIDVRKEGPETCVIYEVPSLEEVVTSFDASGKIDEQGVFIPADDVVINSGVTGRASTSGEIPLFGKKSFSLNMDDVSFSGSFDIKNLEYRFSASPSWHLVTIDEVYLALNSSLEFDAEYMNTSDKNIKKKLGSFKSPLGYGFNASGDIYMIFTAGVGVEIGFEIEQKSGVQYAKNQGLRPVYDIDVTPADFKLKGEVKGGLALEIGAEFLGIVDLVAVGAEGGLALDGELENISTTPIQFCLDGTGYAFLGIYGQIGWDDLNLRFDREIMNSDNSVWKREMHFEESGLVEACTRGNGDYQGYVKRADNNVPIHNAKVQIIKDSKIKDTTYTDSHGYFKGINLKKDTYEVRVSASGYIPFAQTFQIIGGQTTSLETQLMIDNEEDVTENQLTCSGAVTNAYTGGVVAGAEITVRSKFLFGNGDIVAKVASKEDGSYQFCVPAGYYEVTIQKEGFSTNTKPLIMIIDRDDFYISLNPENQSSIDGNLRVVLHWGATPSDLDSHMTGPEGDSMFHVFYADMQSENVALDVDDTTSYGPETISISKTEPGIYSYYIHDYTNLSSDNSMALSESGAYIEIYEDNILTYKINVPQNQSGTLWHVFDYNTDTGMIQLVNELSYHENPRTVGNIGRIATPDSDIPLKDYQIEEEKQETETQKKPEITSEESQTSSVLEMPASPAKDDTEIVE